MAVAYVFLTLGALLILVFIRPALHQLRPDVGTPAASSLPAAPPLAAGATPGTGGSPAAEQDGERVRELEERLADLQETVAALTARLAGTAGAEPGDPAAVDNKPDKALAGKAFRAYLEAALAGGPEGVAPAVVPAEDTDGGRQAVSMIVTPTAAPVPGNQPQDLPGERQAEKAEPGAGQELPGIMAAIRQAHARGESIESLARRFGRGKGEIALILNLHR